MVLSDFNCSNYELTPEGEVYSLSRLIGSFKGDKIKERTKLTPVKGCVWLVNDSGLKVKYRVDWLMRHVYDTCPTDGPLTLPGEVWRQYGSYRISSFGRVMNKHKKLIHPDSKGYYTLTLEDKRLRVKREGLDELN